MTSQIFELHLLWLMVKFQHERDFDQLLIKRMDFQASEKKLTIVYLILGVVYAIYPLYPLMIINYIYVYSGIWFCLKKNMHAQFTMHKKNFLVLIITGTTLYFLNLPTAISVWCHWISYLQGSENPLRVSDKMLLTYVFVNTIGSFLLVIVKPFEDCFECFNRLGPTKNYSRFQYPIKEKMDQYQRMLRD